MCFFKRSMPFFEVNLLLKRHAVSFEGMLRHVEECLVRCEDILQHLVSFKKWVCLKIGYIPNYSHLIRIMIINHWFRGTLFSDTPKCCSATNINVSEHVNIFSGLCGSRSRIVNMSGIDTMPATFTNSKNYWPCCCFCHLHKLMQCAMVKMLLCLFCLLLLLSYACQRHTFNAILQSFSFFIVIGGRGREHLYVYSIYVYIYTRK